MRQTFVHPVPQYGPQFLDLYRHVQPNILFPKQGLGFESTFGKKRRGRLGAQAQKFRSELIKRAQEMNDVVMEEEDEYRKGKGYFKPFDDQMQVKHHDTPPTNPPTTVEHDNRTQTMTEDRSGGDIPPSEVDEIDLGLGGIDFGNEMSLDNTGSVRQAVVKIENGLVKQDPPIHALPYSGIVAGRPSPKSSVVSTNSIVPSTMSRTSTDYDSESETENNMGERTSRQQWIYDNQMAHMLNRHKTDDLKAYKNHVSYQTIKKNVEEDHVGRMTLLGLKPGDRGYDRPLKYKGHHAQEKKSLEEDKALKRKQSQRSKLSDKSASKIKNSKM